MARQLYTDFTLTVDNCDREPIHRPVAVQGSGHVLAIDIENGDLVAATADAPAKFGLTLEQAWQTPAAQWLPTDLVELLNRAPTRARFPVPTTHADGVDYDVIFHVNDNIAIFEFESADASDLDALQVMALTQELTASKVFDTLCSNTAQAIRDVYQYDRVMVYQFDEDDRRRAEQHCEVRQFACKPLTPSLMLGIAEDLFHASP